MANNRLYIIDTETGDKFCLAKSMAYGWYCREGVEHRFEEWADMRDLEASYGNGGKTSFILVCENHPEFERHLTPLAPDRLRRGWLWRIARFLIHLDTKLARIGGR
jgi:hypothetical protein